MIIWNFGVFLLLGSVYRPSNNNNDSISFVTSPFLSNVRFHSVSFHFKWIFFRQYFLIIAFRLKWKYVMKTEMLLKMNEPLPTRCSGYLKMTVPHFWKHSTFSTVCNVIKTHLWGKTGLSKENSRTLFTAIWLIFVYVFICMRLLLKRLYT